MKMTNTVDDDLYWKFQEVVVKRRKTQKDAVEEALRQWVEGAVEDAEGVGADLLKVFYGDDAGAQKELRSVLSEYRKQQQKAASQGGKSGSETPQRSGRNTKTA